MIFRLNPRLLNATAEGGGGAATTTQATTTATTQATAADPAEGFKAALKKHGDDAASLARQAFADAERLRSERDEARGKLPPADAVVLAGDHARAWGELSKLGKPEEIAARLAAGDEAGKKVSAFERRDLIAEAAGSEGFSPKVLGTLAGDLRIEVKDGTRAGKPARIAEVVIVEKDAKGADVEARTPLAKYAEKHWPEFLPSLKGGTAPQQSRPTGPGTGRVGAPAPGRREGDAAPARKRIAF